MYTGPLAGSVFHSAAVAGLSASADQSQYGRVTCGFFFWSSSSSSRQKYRCHGANAGPRWATLRLLGCGVSPDAGVSVIIAW